MGFREFFLGPADVTETAPAAPANVTRTGFEWGVPKTGADEYNQGLGGATNTDRHSQLEMMWEAFLTCPWSWASVNAIARTITAGGLRFDFDTDDGEGDQEVPDKPANVLACERLFRYTNPREDIRQLLRGVISDLLVFGDAFIEVCWVANQPVALFSLDAPSMFVRADAHGMVTGYVQQTDQGQTAVFDPHDVIHISMDSPRSGLYGTPPTQAAILPITTWMFTSATLKQYYRKGAPPSIHVDLPASYSPNEVTRWRNMYAAQNLGPSNIGVPVTTKAGGEVKELQPQKVADLLHAKDQARDEILATYGVPPAMASIVESGNIGGGTGESQYRQFLTNTCNPIATLVLEKLDFALVRQGFGIEGWHLKFDEPDMRDSLVIEQVRDLRIKNGTYTLNKARTEIGEPAIDGGDNASLILTRASILWRDMEAMSKSEVQKNLTGSDLEIVNPADADPTQLEKVAVPVAPTPPPAAQGESEPVDITALNPATPPDPVPPVESARARPLRESWSTYSARVRQAMRELPGRDNNEEL